MVTCSEDELSPATAEEAELEAPAEGSGRSGDVVGAGGADGDPAFKAELSHAVIHPS